MLQFVTIRCANFFVPVAIFPAPLKLDRTAMQRRQSRPFAGPTSEARLLCEADREPMLLAEFQSHDSVASLARAIAKRLGGRSRASEFIVRAKLQESAAVAEPSPQAGADTELRDRQELAASLPSVQTEARHDDHDLRLPRRLPEPLALPDDDVCGAGGENCDGLLCRQHRQGHVDRRPRGQLPPALLRAERLWARR